MTTLAEAVLVDVTLGAEAGGVDFAARLVPTATVSGIVFGSDGRTATGAQVMLIPSSGIVARNATMGACLQANGGFEISDVPPPRCGLWGGGGNTPFRQ